MEIRPLTNGDVGAISTWRYPQPYSTYDVTGPISASGGYWAVYDAEQLVGYCCFGFQARVPGIDEEQGTVDVGYGLRPDLVGRGLGREFVATVCTFALSTFSPLRLRLLILDWNQPSRKVAEALAFKYQRSVRNAQGEFVIMVRNRDGRANAAVRIT
jgi:ribosomal-protein-alanine N-acetyltransferase